MPGARGNCDNIRKLRRWRSLAIEISTPTNHSSGRLESETVITTRCQACNACQIRRDIALAAVVIAPGDHSCVRLQSEAVPVAGGNSDGISSGSGNVKLPNGIIADC